MHSFLNTLDIEQAVPSLIPPPKTLIEGLQTSIESERDTLLFSFPLLLFYSLPQSLFSFTWFSLYSSSIFFSLMQILLVCVSSLFFFCTPSLSLFFFFIFPFLSLCHYFIPDVFIYFCDLRSHVIIKVSL